MIQEAYCSYEVSKLLKEKGFSWECRTCYEHGELKTDVCRQYTDWNSRNEVWELMSAPTHQMAMKWLREVYRIFICIEFDAPTFVTDMYKMDEIDEYGCAKHIPPTIANCKTYEEAVEAALKYYLENLI